MFPKHERLEHLVYHRGCQPIHRETASKLGLFTLLKARPTYVIFCGGERETLDIIAAPECLSHDQVVQWAKAHATHMKHMSFQKLLGAFLRTRGR